MGDRGNVALILVWEARFRGTPAGIVADAVLSAMAEVHRERLAL